MLRRIRELFNDVFRQADLVLLALCIGTSLFGILMIASATRYMHTSKLVLVQAAALCIGAVLYIVVSQVDLNELAKYWKWIFLVGVVFILLLATPLGIAGDTGNKAWLEFPFLPVKVQPAEIVKLTFIIVLAKQLAWLKENRDLRSISSIVMLAAHFGVIFALYYKISSDMGSALVFLFIFACMCFVAGVALRWFLIGGGAAGLFAAGWAAKNGLRVLVLEKRERPARKILVTGKGRCNVTNDCTAEEFLHHVRTNPRFLFSSLGAFPPAKTMELFESLGVELKVERGRRVFPVSDKAEEIRQALLRYADGADIVHDGAKKLLLEPLAQPEEAPAAPENPRHPKKKKPGPAYRCVGVRGTSGREYKADAVLVATGGLSYPTTGSTGDGYKLAQQAGHTLVEPVPSLVSLVSHDADCKKMMGLALKNVTLTLHEDGKAIFEEQGEMLFTHFGISGPLTLSASSHLGDMKKHKYEAFIDLKPALSEEQLYDRITRDFALLANHAAQGALVKLLPSSMQPVMVARWGIDPATRANQITREQKRELVQLMKHWRVTIDARGDLAHAVITSGGVSVREVDPKTMQSKKALGLYFAGEVLDVDAYTGGYNLQIAFCTAQSFANHLE